MTEEHGPAPDPVTPDPVTPDPGIAPDDPPVPPHLVAAWQRGEARLYANTVFDPDTYVRSVELVRRTVEHLRTLAPGSGPLIAAAEQGPALPAAALRDGGDGGPDGEARSTAGIDLAGVAHAALALRQREVARDQACATRLRRLADARRRGDAWVVLEEAGEPSGDPFLPYRRLEAATATGDALFVSATADDDFRRCVHRVEAVHVDLSSGALEEPRNTLVVATVHPDRDGREERARLLRENYPRW